MNKQQIKDLALSNGFKLKQQPNGKMDLNPYVYDFAEALLAKANERVSELEKQFETQMTNDFVTTTDQAKRITELEKYNLDLANESHKYQERCAELEKELANKDLLHVGFTNGAQIKYAKDEEGAFYPDTDGDCYIPLYMLKSHEHRIETTSIEQLRKEQEHG